MSILFGCNREESNESEGLKAALDSRTHRDRLHTSGDPHRRRQTKTWLTILAWRDFNWFGLADVLGCPNCASERSCTTTYFCSTE